MSGAQRDDWAALVERASFPLERLGEAFARDPQTEPPEAASLAGAAARLRAWGQSLGIGGISRLEQRLAWSGLSLDDARRALSEPRLRSDTELPAWSRTLLRVVEASRQRQAAVLAADASGCEPYPFEDLFAPVVLMAGKALRERLESAGLLRRVESLVEPAALRSLERALLARLTYFSAQALYERFDAFRSPLARFMARCSEGEAFANAEYRAFVAAELGDGLWSLFSGLPVLSRLVAQLTDFWIETSAELLTRVAVDFDDLLQFTGTSASSERLVAIESLKADPHQGGRSVHWLRFSSGASVVYKPRSVAVGSAFEGLVAWCNREGAPVRVRAARCLSRDGYGWVEHVAHEACSSASEAARYFEHAGALLALLYVLGATDCHHENLIATKSGPVLIDVETLLHGVANTFVESEPAADGGGFEDTVLGTGFLPRWAFNRERGVAQDISALGADSEQPLLVRMRRFRDTNLDTMALAERTEPLELEKNVARLDGRPLRACDYAAELTRGFEATYRFLRERREALLTPDGPLQAFAGVENRFVFRATETYSRLLAELMRPEFLADGRDFWLGLERLGKAFVVCAAKPVAWPLFHAELSAASQLDIPLFEANTSSDAIVLADGQRVHGFFTTAAYTRMRARLEALDESELALESQLIRGSLVASGARSHNGERWLPAAAPMAPAQCIAAALAIGDDLIARAVRARDGSPSWLGLSYEPLANRYQLELGGNDLYDGRGGIAVFLAALHQVTGLSRFRDAALDALAPVRRELAAFESERRAFAATPGGAATGFASRVYALACAARSLTDASLLADACSLARLGLEGRLGVDADLVAGGAGRLLVWLKLHAETGDARYLHAAQSVGDELLASRASTDGAPRTWSIPGAEPLAGLSHGASGVALALTRLFAITRQERYLEAALEAAAFERTLFSAKQRNWQDRRPGLRSVTESAAPVYSMHWCNGAPGIALARLELVEHVSDGAIREEALSALEATYDHGLSGPDHLCCGNSGRAEVLWHAGNALDDDRFRDAARRAAAAVVARAAKQGGYRIFSNAPAGVSSAGFFNGVSGVGYFLLRLAHAALPPILLFR